MRPVERQFRNHLVLDHGSHRQVLGLQHVRRSRYLDRLGDLSHFKCQVLTNGLLHLHFNVAGGSYPEARVFHFDVVDTGRHRGERVIAVTGGHGGSCCVCGDIHKSYARNSDRPA